MTLTHKEAKPSKYDAASSLELAILEQAGDLLCAGAPVNSDRLTDSFDLFDDERIVAVTVEDGAKDFDGLLFAASGGEPSRGFREAINEEDDGDGEDELNGDRGAPCNGAGQVLEAEINPVLAESELWPSMNESGRVSPPSRYQHQ